MAKQDIAIQRFYRSDAWKIARAIKIANVCGVCEECGAVGTEVHHIIHLTPQNVSDPNISINQSNLKLLCSKCHNLQHNRFEGRAQYTFDADGNLISKK